MAEVHKPTEKTRAIVRRSAGLGLPIPNICALVGHIDPKTLNKHYAEEMGIGKAEANATVADSLFNKVKAGDVTSMIWWTKTQMKWSETVKQEISGEGGGPLTIQLLPQDEQA
jgi:hypothetical protein